MGISVPLPDAEDSWVDLTEGEYTTTGCSIRSALSKPHLQMAELAWGRAWFQLSVLLPFLKFCFYWKVAVLGPHPKINLLGAWNFAPTTRSTYFSIHLGALPDFKAWRSVRVKTPHLLQWGHDASFFAMLVAGHILCFLEPAALKLSSSLLDSGVRSVKTPQCQTQISAGGTVSTHPGFVFAPSF